MKKWAFEKHKHLMQEENWLEFAGRPERGASYCSHTLTYEEYQAFGLKCLACGQRRQIDK